MDRSCDQRITLPDGRVLGFAEYGIPGGKPVLYFHGFPGSRLEAKLTEAAAQRAAVRVIAADRPGYGLSDFLPGRAIGDWPADVERLAEALGIGRFAVLGVSGGAPYAAACAHGIPGRLVGAGIVCGLGPMADPLLRRKMHPANRIGFSLARRSPRMTKLLYEGPAGWIFRRHPESVYALLTLSAPRADRKVLGRPEVHRILIGSIREAFRGGARGPTLELMINARPWGFDLRKIQVPVHLWHGEADATVPVPIGRYLAGEIRNCRSVFLPGEGHFSLPINHMEEILRTLTR